MSANANEILIENSKVSLPIPVINGCYLHSRFNPLKEAEEFAEENFKKVASKSHIIILGLGFGYHVNELVKKITLLTTKYKILIVEPNQNLVTKFNDIFSFDDPNISIVCEESVEDFFFNESLLTFFRNKPAVLIHKPSFNLNKDFYTRFLSFKAPKEVGLYAKKLNTDELHDYFIGNTGSLEDVINRKCMAIKIENRNDYLVQIIGELK